METEIVSVWVTEVSMVQNYKNPLFHIICICQRVSNNMLEWKKENNYMELEKKMIDYEGE